MVPTPCVTAHGHHASVLQAHRWRTAANSAGYLLDHLRPGLSLLDVGCGPGSLTFDLAERVAPGRTLGIDPAAPAIEAARADASARGLDVEFRRADVLDLPAQDERFDVVHAHQVLQHLADPVAALRAMGALCAPGGLVAVRDADYEAMTWYPASSGLDDWLALYRDVARGNGAEPDAGRRLKDWAREAGLVAAVVTASVWCFTTPEDRTWWAAQWAERVTATALADHALAQGLASESDLRAMAAAWNDWAASPDGWFVVVHGEVIARPGR